MKIFTVITDVYSTLINEHPDMTKEDALIAATALHKKMPLLTGNWKRYRKIKGLVLFGSKRKATR